MSTTIINSTSRSTISDSIEYKHSYTELYVKNICSLTLKTCVKNPLCYLSILYVTSNKMKTL